MTALLSVEQITKTYPGVKALQEVSFSVEAGTVHAVMGENGAGKSTLMQVIAGAHAPTSGRLIFDGQKVSFSSTRDASQKGISIVFQEPNMTIAENIFLGAEPRSARVFVDRGELLERARAAMQRLGIALDPDTRLGDLTTAQQQLIEICKALIHEPRLLILDEPTSSLSEAASLTLFKVVHELRARRDHSVYLASHARGVRQLRCGHRIARRQARAHRAPRGHFARRSRCT
ncbi:Ribose ABC transport system, ATP-binding protein RbsA [Candidatus Burkholderia brachyanthoides]|nr:Ribose ABC transport system, ATP-binding protein RbsA [Candidatus Burkholderia brachyanthoides]